MGQGRENSKLQDLQRQNGDGECVWNISGQMLGYYYHGAKPNIVIDIILTCVVLRNLLRKHQDGGDRAPTQTNDVAAIQNEQVVYVPDDNYRNPLGEAKT